MIGGNKTDKCVLLMTRVTWCSWRRVATSGTPPPIINNILLPAILTTVDTISSSPKGPDLVPNATGWSN